MSGVSFKDLFLRLFADWDFDVKLKYSHVDHFLYCYPYNVSSEADYYVERFALSYHPLLCVLAYELSGNVSFLTEAEDYASEVGRIWHFVERSLDVGSGLYDYGYVTEPEMDYVDLHYSEVSLTYLCLAYAFCPSVFDGVALQSRVDSVSVAFVSKAYGGGENYDKTCLSGMVFALCGAGLNSTSFFDGVLQQFYDLYDFRSGLEFGEALGGVLSWRGHLLQVCHVLVVLGLFPYASVNLMVDDPVSDLWYNNPVSVGGLVVGIVLALIFVRWILGRR